MAKAKCSLCKGSFDTSILNIMPKLDGTMPTSKSANKYCPNCYQDEMYRRQIIDYYYNLYDRKIMPTLITSRISALHKQTKLSYMQIFYTTKYLLEIQSVAFSDDFILLIESASWRAMKHYSSVYKLQSAKKYGDIDVVTIDQSNKPPHKPNKNNIRMTDMSSV